MSCHHTWLFSQPRFVNLTTFAQWCWNFLQTSFRHFFAICIKLRCWFFFSFYLFLCAMLFCHHYIFAMFIFVLSTSLCYSFFFFYLFMWALLVIIILFSPCSFSSSFRLLTNRVSFLLKFYMTLQHVFHNMSRDFLSKRMASSLGSGLTSVQLLHTFLFSFVEFLNWNFAFKRI